MNKEKLGRIKAKIKRYLPTIAATAAAVAMAGLAAYYREKYLEADEEANWLTEGCKDQISPGPRLLREVRENGAVLKYKIDEKGNEYYTTLDDFPEL